MVRFDLSGVVPNGAAITTASLTFWQWDPPNTITPNVDLTVGVYEVSRAWSENAVSWTKATATANWSRAGGDYAKKIGPSKVVPKLPVEKFVTYDVTTAVQDWVNNPAGNYGLIFTPEAGNGGDGNDYWSAQHADAAKRPKLVIVYSGGTQTVPGAMDAANLSIAVNVAGRRLSYRTAAGPAVKLSVVDAAGRSVISRSVSGEGTLEMTGIPAGAYIVRLGNRPVLPVIVGR